MYRILLLAITLFSGLAATAQNAYVYQLDLTRASNDRLAIQVQTPRIAQPTAIFAFPKIIPGTYAIADYGKFASKVTAFDRQGKPLPVKKLDVNRWQIGRAASLAYVRYEVEDIFDAAVAHNIYPMAATNIEEGKNFVLNLPGICGFIEGQRNLPFQLQINKPASLYGATSMPRIRSTPTRDEFEARNLDELYDYPMMYSRPDTSTVQVGNCAVQVSVYSPNGKVHAREIAGWLSELLDAARRYLGGKLPADRYSFLYYFREPGLKHSFPPGLGGALEHPTSSFYYLEEAPAEALRNTIVDISSHEFFHIITPLTIASREVKEFNFNKAVLSRHLWLYEGVTEYTSHHVQVKYGLNTVQQFLEKLSGKISSSRTQYNDSLPFTELSVHAAGRHAEEYGNVYEKGALIGACLDLYLLHLSKGTYGLRNLTYDLGVRYGKTRYFLDEELFDVIAELTYPEIRQFLVRHVAGAEPIPYETYFGYAGIDFRARNERRTATFGNISMAVNEKGVVFINQPFQPNEFGKKMGYQAGDELYSINGLAIHGDNMNDIVARLKNSLREGDEFVVRAGRAKNGSVDTITLRAPVMLVNSVELNKLTPSKEATPAQLTVRNAWLRAPAGEPAARPAANPADVATVDDIIKATYEVITGPAGPRNWDRFLSLFLPEAKMGAVGGGGQFRSFTPEEYRRGNAPLFQQSGFYEEELNRSVMNFGNIATVQSSYQYRFAPGGKVEQRGVNYFTLVRSGGRWWIANLSWQDETPSLPLPKELEKR